MDISSFFASLHIVILFLLLNFFVHNLYKKYFSTFTVITFLVVILKHDFTCKTSSKWMFNLSSCVFKFPSTNVLDGGDATFPQLAASPQSMDSVLQAGEGTYSFKLYKVINSLTFALASSVSLILHQSRGK